MRKVLAGTAAALLMTVGFASTAGAQDEPGTIVEIAQATDDLSTLVTAVSEAGLVETLSGEGPFTVFAPTNAAFDALPEGTLDTLLADPTGDLADILKLHVISGEVNAEAATAAAGTNVETLGGPVAVALDGDSLTIGGATIVTTDVQASNGIVHIIDAVITAPAEAAAEEAPAEEAAAVPNAIDSGDSGLAASSSRSNLVFGLFAALALAGLSVGSMTLVRAGREN